MSEREIDPLDCQAKAKQLVKDHIDSRHDEKLPYDVYFSLFNMIGGNWQAIVRTTLPNTAVFIVQHHELKNETTLEVYHKAITTIKY